MDFAIGTMNSQLNTKVMHEQISGLDVRGDMKTCKTRRVSSGTASQLEMKEERRISIYSLQVKVKSHVQYGYKKAS